MDSPLPDALYICPGDPYGAPRGGQTAFAIQALNAFGSRFALVAPDETKEKPTGVWFIDHWRGRPIWRLNVGSFAPKNKSRRPIVPRRIIFRRLIAKHMPTIRKISTRNIFCDSPELLGVLKKYEWDSFCYRFAGLNNPVGVSRYGFLRFLAAPFHRLMLKNLARLKPDALLASADLETIAAFEEENKKILGGLPLRFFPTRFDQEIFHPGNVEEQRRALNLLGHKPILVSVGRLCWVKGWRLALESVAKLKLKYPRITLIFIGDGEDRTELERAARELGVWENLRMEGFLAPQEVYKRLVAADLYLCASYREGWSVAMTEALGCGKICVSTPVSGAGNMIDDGVNGRIVDSRDPVAFAQAIDDALDLKARSTASEQRSLELARQYSTETLAGDWGALWRPLAAKE